MKKTCFNPSRLGIVSGLPILLASPALWASERVDYISLQLEAAYKGVMGRTSFSSNKEESFVTRTPDLCSTQQFEEPPSNKNPQQDHEKGRKNEEVLKKSEEKEREIQRLLNLLRSKEDENNLLREKSLSLETEIQKLNLSAENNLRIQKERDESYRTLQSQYATLEKEKQTWLEHLEKRDEEKDKTQDALKKFEGYEAYKIYSPGNGRYFTMADFNTNIWYLRPEQRHAVMNIAFRENPSSGFTCTKVHQ